MARRVAFVFPGQGSQRVGMAEALKGLWPAYEEHLAIVEAAAGGLGGLIDSGPAEELAKTENAQVALLLVSHGWDQVLRAGGVQPAVVAGHSVGEYAALVSAGVIDFTAAGALVAERGRLMAEAGRDSDGAMAAVLGVDLTSDDLARLDELAARPLAVEVANINAPGQVVISGPRADVARAAELLGQLGARRVVPLAVSGAFHSSAMRPAAAAFAARLQAAPFGPAAVPVVQNTTAAAATEPAEMKAALEAQMTGSVRWVESVRAMAANADVFVEVGPGTVLKGLIRRIVADAGVYSVDDDADRDAVLAMTATGPVAGVA